MRVVIIDDEPLARNTLINIINTNHPSLEVLGEADAVQSAIKLIEQTKPELIFLDIDLKDGSGFDLLNLLDKIDFKIIFITAHQEYAIKAIKFSAFDYILKPISALELSDAVLRAQREDAQEAINLKFDVLKNNNLLSDSATRKLVLKTSDSIHLVVISDIIRCEADNNYTTFYLTDKTKIVISKGLKEYEDLLTEYGFFRVHQSHLINVKEIKRFEKKDGGFLVLSDDSQIPVSQRKKQKLLDLFHNLQ